MSDEKKLSNSDNINEGINEIGTLFAATRDALNDDMITRLSSALSEGISLLDRLTRNESLIYLLQELDRPDNQKFLASLADAISATSREVFSDKKQPSPVKGGVINAYQLLCDPNTQEALALVALLAKNLKQSIHNNK